MKIIWNENPLKTKVELSELDLVNMRNVIKIEELHNEIFDSYYKVDDIQVIKNSLETIINGEDDPDSKINKRVEQLMSYYIDELTLGHAHLGDCTKSCCSCTKCAAEEVLGVNTLAGLKGLYFISSAFCNRRSLNEAIDYLQQVSKYDEVWQQPHIDRWESERKSALDSLIKYKEELFSEQR